MKIIPVVGFVSTKRPYLKYSNIAVLPLFSNPTITNLNFLVSYID